MRITATQIENWADTRDAQATLSLLLRRLVSATSKTMELSIPGGDSVNAPGWDGQTNASQGNAWVPIGEARWEVSCRADIIDKARSDFKKRSAETPAEIAITSVFIFVSSRRWRQKHAWATEANQAGHWAAVRAFDADDLEAWIETAPGVTLWFGGLLGLSGNGIESIACYWQNWCSQTRLHLTPDALLAGREDAKRAFSEALSKPPQLIAIEADSREEAVAFACTQLLGHALGDCSACITSAEGWRFADANPQLSVGIAINPEVAAQRGSKDGFTMIVPLSTGDKSAYLTGSAATAADTSRIVLDRPKPEHFEEALRKLGEEESDATRLTRSTGRSWSVYRRVRAKNPAIRYPTWMSDTTSRCLVAVTLVGAWNSKRAGDQACLEAISDRKYDVLETELLSVARRDDSPVLQIGAVWKAKASIDLLYLFGPEISAGELSRFFSVAEAVLTKPDPALEIEDSKRWMAAVYGKVREESGLVIDAIADSLPKLRVYAENSEDANAVMIMAGVDGLVRSLLGNANGERWLSLSGVLRELAEASPDEFLTAVETSLRRDDAPIRRLLNETGESGAFGRCWHADLLWALEVLAWYPPRLGRVADILAQLIATPIKGNWGNTPVRTLVSLFRGWWPQTTATAEQRLAVLDRLVRTHNDVGWTLMLSLVPRFGEWASTNARPRWRDDDAGTNGQRQSASFGQYLSDIGSRLIAQADGHPGRIADLVRDADRFEGEYRESIIRLVEGAINFDDDGREAVRTSLRHYLNWHNSFNRDGAKQGRATADCLRPYFDALAPLDIVKRQAWHFTNGWVELPDGHEEDFSKQDELRSRLRADALREVFNEHGWDGLTKLTLRCADTRLIGWEVAKAKLPKQETLDWIVERFVVAGHPIYEPLVSGFLHALPSDQREATLMQVLGPDRSNLTGSNETAAFLSNAPCQRDTWRILEQSSNDVQRAYWQNVRPGYLHAEAEDLAYLVDRLTDVGRHRTAFQAGRLDFNGVDHVRILRILEGIRIGEEPDGPLPDGWQIGKAIEVLESSERISRRELALLEFAFYHALEHGERGTKNLYAEMLSDPALFMECICLVYRRHNSPPEPLDDSKKGAAEMAWSILHNGRGVPGLQTDGSIDRSAFVSWVETVRNIAKEQDREGATDSVIGQWLSSCPADSDGKWPNTIVSDLLDQTDADEIRSGFSTGIVNNRGVFSRSYGEGGDQERALASNYREFANRLHNSHPQVAAMLERVAGNYEYQARGEDSEAQLRVEGN